jgi:NADH-quinone oxidoreductase subunit G
MSDIVNIKINGVDAEAKKGQMIIEVTDSRKVHVPRFCYHPELSIAANCRMCMVEVKNIGKPLPACATPVAEGMEIFTKSNLAIAGQKGTMEFLLLNHPLDCPICDQGGECELQDLALGHGQGRTRYDFSKRVVKDKNVGSLVSTDMTRCIHCTRCIRFGDEILGQQNLGTVGRGEETKIDTFLENSLDHELSGNVIDICPVGALNSKPYRFSARAWEMIAKPSISIHDGIGTNTYAHVLRNEVKRVVPRVNGSINGNWIADRDRFSYVALDSKYRIKTPQIVDGLDSKDASWDEAIALFVNELNETIKENGPDAVSLIVSPNTSLEEMFLIKRIANHFHIKNIDYRIKDSDFSTSMATHAVLNTPKNLSDLSKADYFLLVGTHLRDEAPILASQINKYSKEGAKVSVVGGKQKYLFETECYLQGESFVQEVLSIASAFKKLSLNDYDIDFTLTDFTSTHNDIAKQLVEAKEGVIMVGQLAVSSPHASLLQELLVYIARQAQVSLVFLPYGANSYGAELIGLLPYKDIGGAESENTGLNLRDMLKSPRKIYILYGLEVEDLSLNDLVCQAFSTADSVYLFSSFTPLTPPSNLKAVLPIATHMELSGTYINFMGQWQNSEQVVTPPDNLKEGWRVLRFIGSQLDVSEFNYQSIEDIRSEITNIESALTNLSNEVISTKKEDIKNFDHEIMHDSIYQRDAMLRRAECLQQAKLDIYL